jgi:hypothetical protein
MERFQIVDPWSHPSSVPGPKSGIGFSSYGFFGPNGSRGECEEETTGKRFDKFLFLSFLLLAFSLFLFFWKGLTFL